MNEITKVLTAIFKGLFFVIKTVIKFIGMLESFDKSRRSHVSNSDYDHDNYRYKGHEHPIDEDGELRN
jgi:hypothetical protein